MTTFSDEVTAQALVVQQGVHAGPSGAGEPGAMNGSVHVYDVHGNLTIALDAGGGDPGGPLGTITADGGIYTAAVHVGLGSNAGGTIHVYKPDGKTRALSIDGTLGDIVLANGDIAEEFDLDNEGPSVAPGDVIVISGSNRVTNSAQTFDCNVIGVAAGAGAYRPGLVLDHDDGRQGSSRVAVSLVGKAGCHVATGDLPIRPGDFLVTSAKRGAAMRAPEHHLPRGVVFARALGHLEPRSDGIVTVLLGGR